MLSRQIYGKEWKYFEKQIKQVENKRSNKYYFNSIRKQTFHNQTNFVIKDREDSLKYYGVPYRTEMQTPRLDKFTSDRKATRIKSQVGE